MTIASPDAAVVACLIIFVGLSFVDGIVVHLWRERLFRRAEARLEHALHTARAALFPVILLAFFGGKAVTLGVAALVVDQLVEIADMAVERRSRAFSGGLRSSEYVLHGALITVRAAGIAFALVAGPPSARLLWLVDVLVPGAILTALLHVALMAPRLSRRPA